MNTKVTKALDVTMQRVSRLMGFKDMDCYVAVVGKRGELTQPLWKATRTDGINLILTLLEELADERDTGCVMCDAPSRAAAAAILAINRVMGEAAGAPGKVCH